MILLSFCSLPWWLPWLLSFLLGFLAAWGLWSKYQSRVKDLESDNQGLKKKIVTLEGDLATCNARRAEVESELALVKGRMREMETASKLGKASGTDSNITIDSEVKSPLESTEDESPGIMGGT